MNYREKECPKCNGERWLENTEDGSNYKCDLCNGSGSIGWITNDDSKTDKQFFRQTKG